MQVNQYESPNTSSRKGRVPVAIVNHITAGNYPGCRSWLCNPGAQASAHYVIARDGTIDQLADESLATWHAGIVNHPDWPLYDGTNPNRYTIGIEHEGFDGTLTEEQYQATLWLHRQIIARWGIPVDPDHIIGHYRIDAINRPNCPGPGFPWERLFADLAGPQYPSVNIFLKGQPVSGYLVPINNEPRSCAMAAQVAQILGIQFNWDPSTNTMFCAGYTGPAIAWTSYPKVAIGNKLIPSVMIQNHNYVPVALICLALGMPQAKWDQATMTAVID